MMAWEIEFVWSGHQGQTKLYSMIVLASTRKEAKAAVRGRLKGAKIKKTRRAMNMDNAPNTFALYADGGVNE